MVYKLENYYFNKNGGSYSLFSSIVTQIGQANVLYYMYFKAL